MTRYLVGISSRLNRPRTWLAVLGSVLMLIALAWTPVEASNDSDSPFVVSHTPATDENQVPVDEAIVVSWSQPMAANTDFVVTGPMGFVAGTFDYDELSYSVSFAPYKDLEPAARYGVIVAGQTDAMGRKQDEVVQWSFNTVAPTAVTLAEFSAKPTVRQSWWWSAWPWLMLLISAVSLMGFVRVWMRQGPIRWVEKPD